MIFLKVCGSIFLLLAARLVIKGYSAYVKRRILEGEGFRFLLLHIEGEIRKYLKSESEIISSFENEALSNVGFFDGGGGLAERFHAVRSRLLFSERIKKLLSEFFDAFGRDYGAKESARASEAAQAIEVLIKTEREQLQKNERCIRALVIGVSLGIVILLI